MPASHRGAFKAAMYSYFWKGGRGTTCPFVLKRRCAGRWPPMVCRLFVGVGELNQVAVVIGASNETHSRWQVVARETRRNYDRRHVNQECIQMRRTFLVDKGRVDTVANQSRLVLDGFMHDSVELVFGHDHEKICH